MTDQELKELVANLALAQQKTEALVADLVLSQKKTDAQLAKTDQQQIKTETAIANFLVAQQKTDEQLARTAAQLAKTDAQLAKTDQQQIKTETAIANFLVAQQKTDEQMARTDAKLEKLARMYGGAANNQGLVAEEFYFNSLKEHRTLQGIHFDSIDKNLTRERDGIQDEFDILLLNDQNVFIIEVKYKAHPDDLKRLIDKKAANFKKLFPAYSKHRHHLGLASFYLDDRIIDSALGQGVTLLQRKGDLIETKPVRPFH